MSSNSLISSGEFFKYLSMSSPEDLNHLFLDKKSSSFFESFKYFDVKNFSIKIIRFSICLSTLEFLGSMQSFVDNFCWDNGVETRLPVMPFALQSCSMKPGWVKVHETNFPFWIS